MSVAILRAMKEKADVQDIGKVLRAKPEGAVENVWEVIIKRTSGSVVEALNQLVEKLKM